MLSERDEQIIQAHAAFICQAAELTRRAEARPQLEQLLQTARDAGWHALADAIGQMADGRTELAGIGHLDDEDRVIAEAVLRGMQNPATLPDPDKKPEPQLAAPGLAGMIHAAATGDMQAFVLIGQMAEQMSRAGGDMARIAGAIRPLINGERNPDTLARGMDERARALLQDILEELEKLAGGSQ